MLEPIEGAGPEAVAERAARWAARYGVQPPVYEHDLAAINPAFVRWLGAQSIDVQNDIASYWCGACEDPSIAQGARNAVAARMTMVIQYAFEQHGYTP